jgi:hypothetical protein
MDGRSNSASQPQTEVSTKLLPIQSPLFIIQ